MKRNVYDFDKTIYDGDSTTHFYFYCLKKYPYIAVCWIWQIIWYLLFAVKIVNKTVFKQHLYCFLKMLKDIDGDIEDFWDKHIPLIKEFYKKNQKQTDIIISASPEFLLKPICRRIGIDYLLASRVDKKTGKYTGLNCWGDEKVQRLNSAYPDTQIEEFYSDSLSDLPLARLAQRAYLVDGEVLTDWNVN